MIKKNWKLLILLAMSLAVLLGYRFWVGLRTDSIAPKITIADSEIPEVSVFVPEQLLEGVTAEDDRDGDVTASLVVERVAGIQADGTVTVTYAAFDSSGNVAKVQRTVRYVDYEGPRFTLSKSLAFVYGSNFDVLNVVGAEDLLDGDIGYRVKATSLDGNSVNEEGTHSVCFRVTNSLGDQVELVLPVEVYYSGRYNAQLYLTDYLIYLEAGASFDPMAYLQEHIAKGEVMDLTDGVPQGVTLDMEDRVDTAVPGVYTVAYTVTRTLGNTEYEGYARLIVVVEG